MIKAAMFDTKPYDNDIFEKHVKGTDIKIKYFEAKLNEDTAGLAKNYDAIIPFVNDTLSSQVIDALGECGVKLIAMRCAGFNNVDIKHAHGKIPVVRVPEYSPYAVAEHAMAMLLTNIRRIHKAYIRTRDFNFSLNGLTGFDLHGRTAGIIGTGKIGRCFIDICRGFGMKVIAYDPYPVKNSGIDYVELDDLFKNSDVISLHCPLTQHNRHIISEETIAMMKKGVVLINTSRGALINTDALIHGIKSKKIGAACLDVYEEESDIFFEDYSGHIVHDDTLARLITLPNVLITSHQAFLTEEALNNIAETTVGNITAFFKDGTLKNEVQYRN